MLNREANERLTKVGAGTPVGELLRRYWHPVAASVELKSDAMIPLRVLGEDLVLFRDGRGKLGLVEDRCAHRGVRLSCGFSDHVGLRCPYHGWCYDTTGQCVDQPAEPAESRLKDSVKITSYPVRELSGMVFAYLGPLPVPQLPGWDRLLWDHVVRDIGRALIPCNWLQTMENAVDPMHAPELHGRFYQYLLQRAGIPADDPQWVRARGFKPRTKFDVVPFEFGFLRKVLEIGKDETTDQWAIGYPTLFPNISAVGGGGVYELTYRVPIDDFNTMQITNTSYDPGDGVEIPKQEDIPLFEIAIRDNGGSFNRYQVMGQDAMAFVEQGAVADRTRETLGTSDKGVVLYRRTLEQQLRAVAEGRDPMNVFRAEEDCAFIALPKSEDWSSYGKAKDGSYKRGGATGALKDGSPIQALVEDLFVKAAESRSRAGTRV